MSKGGGTLIDVEVTFRRLTYICDYLRDDPTIWKITNIIIYSLNIYFCCNNIIVLLIKLIKGHVNVISLCSLLLQEIMYFVNVFSSNLLNLIIGFQMYNKRVKEFNASLNNVSVLSWRSVSLVEETGVPGIKPHRPVAGNW